ncbi:MAG: hypothetical protein ABJA70_12745 [Chryseolinea sp.]
MKSILFPFVYETDFRAGYSWSLELATRLKCQLSIFTTIPCKNLQHYSQLYDSLIKARQFHVRKFGMSSLEKRPQSVIRHFVTGDFESTFLRFVEDTKSDILVIPTRIISETVLTNLNHSRKQIIYLPSTETEVNMIQSTSTRDVFFFEMLERAVCYNLPTSFYKSFGDDKSLFNSIASFFKRPRFDAAKLTAR